MERINRQHAAEHMTEFVPVKKLISNLQFSCFAASLFISFSVE